MNAKERADNILNIAKHQVANTIGYHECPNKPEFNKGVDIFIYKLRPILEELIINSDKDIERAELQVKQIRETISNFAELLKNN